MKRGLILCALVLLFAAFIPASVSGDDHVVEERTRTYYGRTLPPMKTEIWIGESVTYYQSRNFMYIKRHDLKKMITINMRNKRYFEEPLDPPRDESREESKRDRIQTKGFHYRPVYDWVVEKTDEEKTIDGKACSLYVLDGDADYAEERRELWVTSDLPIDIERYFKRIIEPGLDKEWRLVYERHPGLAGAIAMESRFITENAIARTLVWDNRIVSIESADPPEGIYEIPDGLTRVKTRDELYAR